MPDLESVVAPYVLDPTGADIPGEAALLRKLGRLVAVELPDGIRAWAVTTPDLLKTLFADPRVVKDPELHWPAYQAGEVPDDWALGIWVRVRNMLTADGDRHTRLRRLVAPAFTPRRISALKPQIDQITSKLLDDLAEHPKGAVVDLRERLAAQVPVQVMDALMGVPIDLQSRLRVCVREVFATRPERDPRETFDEMADLLITLVARRRADPGDDMTSLLIFHRDQDDHLSEEELVSTLMLMVNAGYETTANLLEQSVFHVLTHPYVNDQLRSGSRGWAEVIEQTLRDAPPVSNLPLRFAAADIDIDGESRIRKGEPLIAAIAAANRRPNPSGGGTDPDEFDPAKSTEHLSFGYHRHFCLGAALARLEAETALPALFKRFPDMALAVEPGTIPTLDSFISQGHSELPVYLTGVPVT